MKNFYWIWIITSLLFGGISLCQGQQANIIATDRDDQAGVVSFSENSKLTGISDSKFVDGYVKKYGSGFFTFPVGHNQSYRPFAAETDGTYGAYFQIDPGAATSSIGGPFSSSSKDAGIASVSTSEFWDIKGVKPTRLTLTWNAGSNLAALTGNEIRKLTIVGWNAGAGRWESVVSVVDEISVLGGQSSVAAGSITTAQQLVPDTYSGYTLASLTAPSLPSLFGGIFESANCIEIKGWVWDSNYPNSSVAVELVEGSTVLATATADIYREDLKNSGFGTGKYGYKMAIPTGFLGDGLTHQLTVRVRNSKFVLNGSPRSVNCSFDGSFEDADCYRVKGWVWDQNDPGKPLIVELAEGGNILAMAVADIYREDLKDAGKGTGKYGFSINIPNSIKNGNPHELKIRVPEVNYTLSNSPKTVSCATNQFTGNFELLDCNVVQGWAWDRSYPNSTLTVELVEGNTVHATVVAGTYREILKSAGPGATGNYGFSFALPAALKNGQPHQLSIRVKGSTAILPNSPRSITCATNQYQGSLDLADCNLVQGWAWDKNNPNAAVTVELVEGSTVHATVVASTYRDYLKAGGIGTGNYGFSIPLPQSLKSGSARQVSVRVQGSTTTLSNSPKTVTCAANLYGGNFELLDCNVVQGWAWDRNNPGATLTVELVEGSTVHATAVAGTYREILKSAGPGATGNYGFSFALPATLKDGQSHQLSIRVKGSATILPNSPRTVNCAANLYGGNFELLDCNVVQGWAWDRSYPNSTLTVELVEGSTVHATVVAGTYREILKSAGPGATGNYGFSFALPAALKNGQPHQLSIRVKGSTAILPNSPRSITCATNQYQGSLDLADCNLVQGWAWDKNNPNAAVTVELVEGSTVHATVVASTYRDYLKAGGIGTGNYGFSIPLPQSLKSGSARQVSVRVQGSTTTLSNSPKTVTCAANLYGGNFELLDCNVVQGWAWDRSYPNSTLTVELVEGNTVHATVVAGTYREILKSAGPGATGNYGFSFALPAALKNGQPHQLSIRVKGSTAILPNSPRSITCATNQYQGSLDLADCNLVQGWAWDKNNPNAAVTVELVEGSTVHATVVASTYRDYLKAGGIGTGNYGFSIPLPQSLKSGSARQVSVRVQGSTTTLSNSPKTVTCAANLYGGNFELLDCNVVQGWAWDRSYPNSTLTVELVEGNTVHATVVAGTYREILKSAGPGATGNYGFSFALPAALKNGQPHQLSIRVKGSTAILPNSPRSITCATNQYQGSLDLADCNLVQGWAWDKNNPNAAVTVELVEGSTVHATVVASTYRDYLKAGGIGTGNYGFSIPLPQSLKSGSARQVSVRVQGSTTTLSNSPKTVTCAANLYGGNFELLDCNVVQGWAWDRNNPGATLTVELVEGSTVHATAVAGTYREILKSAGPGATGNYGFSFALPATLKDGQSHQFSIRVKGSATILPNSPKTITCSSAARQSYEVDLHTEANVIPFKNEQLEVVLTIFPNPTSRILVVKFGSITGETARLSIVNLLGHTMWTKFLREMRSLIREEIDLRDLPDGTYLVKLEVGDKLRVERFVLIK